MYSFILGNYINPWTYDFPNQFCVINNNILNNLRVISWLVAIFILKKESANLEDPGWVII